MYNLPVDVQMIRLDKGQHKQEEYLAINPLGKVKGCRGCFLTAAAAARLAPAPTGQGCIALHSQSWTNMLARAIRSHVHLVITSSTWCVTCLTLWIAHAATITHQPVCYCVASAGGSELGGATAAQQQTPPITL
jgi:hypothetical protein